MDDVVTKNKYNIEWPSTLKTGRGDAIFFKNDFSIRRPFRIDKEFQWSLEFHLVKNLILFCNFINFNLRTIKRYLHALYSQKVASGPESQFFKIFNLSI